MSFTALFWIICKRKICLNGCPAKDYPYLVLVRHNEGTFEFDSPGLQPGRSLISASVVPHQGAGNRFEPPRLVELVPNSGLFAFLVFPTRKE